MLFLIDINDEARFGEARDELDALVADGAIADVPLAILINKCD